MSNLLSMDKVGIPTPEKIGDSTPSGRHQPGCFTRGLIGPTGQPVFVYAPPLGSPSASHPETDRSSFRDSWWT
jgi:hypothetical protein